MLDQLRYMDTPEILVAIIDILVVAFIIYQGFVLIRGTRAVQLLKGIVVLVLATTISRWLHLDSLNWLLDRAQFALLVGLPIVFQPELRRALEQLGRGRFFGHAGGYLPEEDLDHLIDEVLKATNVLQRNRYGALIVFERETGLEDVMDTGIRVDGRLTAELLVNIFIPNTPLHDGAVIVRRNRVAAAACFLPLTTSPEVSIELGSRHRAALGMSEESDALVLVLSEETGLASIALDGKLQRGLSREMIRSVLKDNLSVPTLRRVRNLGGR